LNVRSTQQKVKKVKVAKLYGWEEKIKVLKTNIS